MALNEETAQGIEGKAVGALQTMSRAGISGCQARAARAMLMWSIRRLAEHSKISESSVRRIESEFGIPETVTLDLLFRLRDFYEARGFHFFFEDGFPAVVWRRRDADRTDE